MMLLLLSLGGSGRSDGTVKPCARQRYLEACFVVVYVGSDPFDAGMLRLVNVQRGWEIWWACVETMLEM